MQESTKKKLIPFILTAIAIIADQVSKAIIVKLAPNEYTSIWPQEEGHNAFLWIYHVRNKAIAFSLGQNLPEALKPVLFVAVPLLVLGFLVWYYLKSNEFTMPQRWALAGILGGGIGNIIDRIFRPDGVVDFISVKFYGLFGFERWPTFNFADSFVVVCGLLLLVTIFIEGNKGKTGK